jgi:subfamily B ATP-binding cassette protein MsbA
VTRLFHLARPFWRRLLLGLAAAVAASAVRLAVPVTVGRLIDSLLAGTSAANLNVLTARLLVLFVLASLLAAAQQYAVAGTGERLVLDVRRRLYHHVLRLGQRFYDHRPVGELAARTIGDVAQLQTAATSNVVDASYHALALSGACLLLFMTHWRLAAVVVLVLLPPVVAGRLYGRHMRRLSFAGQEKLAEAGAAAQQALAAIRIVRGFSREDYEVRRFGGSIDEAFRLSTRRARLSAVLGPLTGLATWAGLAAILWVGGRAVIAGQLSVGQLSASAFYASIAGTSVSNLITLYGQVQAARGASRRVFELLDAPLEEAGQGTVELRDVRGRIAFENVSFGYEPGRHAVFDVNLVVQPGHALALVGRSGAGKTTLVDLLARFYEPEQGRITLDGIDIRTCSLASLRAQLGLVPQETLLFNASLRENLRYGRLDATDAEIEAAARAAYVDDFAQRLPNKYDTPIGERGVKLSGGERQRVAIARALLKDPRILLLDDATSEVDVASERLIQVALARLMQGRTSIVIAHRLSTVRQADLVAVLEAGRVVETGTHQALLERRGLYWELFGAWPV